MKTKKCVAFSTILLVIWRYVLNTLTDNVHHHSIQFSISVISWCSSTLSIHKQIENVELPLILILCIFCFNQVHGSAMGGHLHQSHKVLRCHEVSFFYIPLYEVLMRVFLLKNEFYSLDFSLGFVFKESATLRLFYISCSTYYCHFNQASRWNTEMSCTFRRNLTF